MYVLHGKRRKILGYSSYLELWNISRIMDNITKRPLRGLDILGRFSAGLGGSFRCAVIFLYNLYFFVWIYHGCKTNTIYVLDPNNSVIKRLWCICSNSFPKTSVKLYFSFLYTKLKISPSSD